MCDAATRICWAGMSVLAAMASRIASHATAGQVLTSEDTARRCDVEGVRFDSVGAVRLKGLASPLNLYRALREVDR